MGTSNSTVAHRFANRDYNPQKGLTGSSTHISWNNYYSYNTVFGQWVDENVCVVFRGDTSITSSKHLLNKGYFPEDVHVFPYDDGGGRRGWHGCNLVWYGDFTQGHRLMLIDYYIGCIYEQIKAIVIDGRKKGLEKIDFSDWEYVLELCSIYKDTSVSKWCKSRAGSILPKREKEREARKIKLAKLLNKGERNVEVLTDALFGEGSFREYWVYCARFRKSERKREKVLAICERLGIRSPYREFGSGLDHNLSPNQILALSAKQRLEMHFASILREEERKQENEAKEKYNKNFRNAYRWIVGCEPHQSWIGYKSDISNDCINKDTGQRYECGGSYVSGFFWLDTSVSFEYNLFRTSEDKEQWIADFYAKCKEVDDNRKAICILKRIKAHTKEKARSYDDDQYINDDYLRENTTDEEYNLCAELIRKQDRHYADEAARARAREIERIRREEENRKEKEFRDKVKQEQIEECIARGIEGRRDLWRKHLTTISFAEDLRDKDEYYYGGNVLLRLNLGKDRVETSKNI